MPSVLVLRDNSPEVGKVAQAIARAANDAGAAAVVASADEAIAAAQFDFVFVGGGAFGPLASFDAQLLRRLREIDWTGKKLCVFAVCSGSGRKALEKLAQELQQRGGRVLSTLALELKGLMAFAGKGELSETDLARAYAFGERYSSALTGTRGRREKEKERIRGYKKQEA